MSNIAAAIVKRYSDAYLVARTINGFGITVKAIGVIIGSFIALAALSASKGSLGVIAVFGGVILGSIVATGFFLFGTLASAQGQILKAALDTAVNTSRWLSDDDRASIMSLPSPATATAVTPRGEWRCRCGQKNPAGAGACLECGAAA